jgi:hypothetical protein
MTKEEFTHMLQLIRQEMEATNKLEAGEKWRYSWDNASVHLRDDEVPDMIKSGLKWALPPWSPDMHKVIEHFFHRLKEDFWIALARRGKPITTKQAQDLLRKLARDMPVEYISKDVMSLKYTYSVIAAPEGSPVKVNGDDLVGTGGWYPAPHLR